MSKSMRCVVCGHWIAIEIKLKQNAKHPWDVTQTLTEHTCNAK